MQKSEHITLIDVTDLVAQFQLASITNFNTTLYSHKYKT